VLFLAFIAVTADRNNVVHSSGWAIGLLLTPGALCATANYRQTYLMPRAGGAGTWPDQIIPVRGRDPTEPAGRAWAR